MRQKSIINLNTLSITALILSCSHFPGSVLDNKRFYGYRDDKYDGRLRC